MHTKVLLDKGANGEWTRTTAKGTLAPPLAQALDEELAELSKQEAWRKAKQGRFPEHPVPSVEERALIKEPPRITSRASKSECCSKPNCRLRRLHEQPGLG